MALSESYSLVVSSEEVKDPLVELALLMKGNNEFILAAKKNYRLFISPLIHARNIYRGYIPSVVDFPRAGPDVL